MEKARQIQLKAADALGQRVAELSKWLDEMAASTNTLEAEAKLYFIGTLSQRISEEAKRYHAEMHRVNSVPGDWKEEEYTFNMEVRS